MENKMFKPSCPPALVSSPGSFLLPLQVLGSSPVPRLLLWILICGLATIPSPLAHAQIFVVNDATGTIGEYTASGATVNTSLITGLTNAFGLALDGDGHIFVAYSAGSAGCVGEYTTAGAAVNATLISGLHTPDGLVVIPHTMTSPAVKLVSPHSLTASRPSILVTVYRFSP